MTGCNDKHLRMFDLQNYSSDPIVFSGHTSNIKKVLFLEQSKKILSISDDKTLRVWNTQLGDGNNTSGKEIFQLKLPSAPTSVEISRDNQQFILAYGNQVEIYNANTFEKLKSFTIPNHVSACCFHPDKSVFVCAGENFTLYKYSIENGTELGKILNNYLILRFFLN